MELTIDQALQQGITAHKEGKLEEAERLYRAILQSQPTHPDANHNLGIIAASVNQAEAALPMFRAALEANPKIEQFWLSYIDALIKEKQFYNAKQALEQAKKQGVAGEKLNVLGAQLGLINEPGKASDVSPSQQQLSSLLEHHQNGRFSDAEKLATSITQEFPKHQLGWKVLGAVLKQTSRVSESLVASQKSVQLAPQDPEAHYNLGVTLKELGRLDEAEASYRQAIVLKPDHTETHYNLGNTLQELGRLDEAEASYKQAIVLKPDLAEPHSNLGTTLQKLGRLDEAEASCRQAIALKPDLADAHYNLGITLKELGRLEEAAFSYTKASFLQPKNPQFYVLRGLTPSLIARQSLASRDDLMKFINYGDWEGSENILRQIFAENPDHIVAHVAEFINLWCIFCQKLINQNVLKNLVPIFINLFVMGERNNDVNELIKHLFERFDIENILKLVKPENKILVYLSYCQYSFLNENFLHSESIAIDNIQKAERLIKVTDTEDLGWLVVRRSLVLCKRKDVSKTALKNLISNLVN